MRSLSLSRGVKRLAYFLCSAPPGTTLAELVAVAGARWAIEDCFAEAENETGLGHYQVRRYRAWCRHITLSMLVHAFLAVTAAAANCAQAPPPVPGQAPADAAKKGTRCLWAAVQPAQDI